MSNIIDSLKRLERIGDETSKTNQKLIQAAADLAEIIVKQFAAGPSENITLCAGMRDRTNSAGFANYQIVDGQLAFLSPRRGFVALNRDNASRFSTDVANGLLDYLAENAAERLKEAGSGLTAIEDALSKIKD